ncbi:MAG: hypothetical protein AB8I08_40230 [Sandaracinaceae bacterium]
MLPPFIIDQIRRREDKVRDAPVRELPLPMPKPRAPKHTGDEEQKRGVVIIDLGG